MRDDVEAICREVRALSAAHDIVITAGGLGEYILHEYGQLPVGDWVGVDCLGSCQRRTTLSSPQAAWVSWGGGLGPLTPHVPLPGVGGCRLCGALLAAHDIVITAGGLGERGWHVHAATGGRFGADCLGPCRRRTTQASPPAASGSVAGTSEAPTPVWFGVSLGASWRKAADSCTPALQLVLPDVAPCLAHPCRRS